MKKILSMLSCVLAVASLSAPAVMAKGKDCCKDKAKCEKGECKHKNKKDCKCNKDKEEDTKEDKKE